MYTTIQTPEQLTENVGLLKRMMGETTRINIIPEQGMTPQQLSECRHNAAAFDQYLRSKHMTESGADYSIQNLKSAYVFLRDNGLLQFEVAPKVNKTTSVYAEQLQKKNHARDKSKDPVEEAPKTLAEEQKKAVMRVAVNQGIERLRGEIASYSARTHSKSARAREEMTAALNRVIKGRRHLYDVVMCEDEIKTIGAKYWDE